MDDLTPKRNSLPLWIRSSDKKEPGRYEKEYAKLLSKLFQNGFESALRIEKLNPLVKAFQ